MRHVQATMVAITITLLLVGCKQAEGDRCQLDSDCDDGLICCYFTTKTVKEGICLPQSKCDLTPESDGGQEDSAVDGPEQDSESQPDTVSPDTVAPDTVAPDTVAPDTVSPDTVSPDTVSPDTVAPDTTATADSTSAG
jgi:hypothetical protein